MNVHPIAKASGASAHQPSQTWLQIAATINGRHEKRE
jgi:hypothetical protein